MAKSILECLIGDLKEKRAYRQMTKRVKALPNDYRFAFKKMRQYMYNYGAVDYDIDINMLTDLVDLLEESASQKKPILEVVGNDVAAFCDELIKASAHNDATKRKKLNDEVMAYFRKEE